jgi:hypothetical protein
MILPWMMEQCCQSLHCHLLKASFSTSSELFVFLSSLLFIPFLKENVVVLISWTTMIWMFIQ